MLGTCVACKACKTECPAGVDMAALKAEWLAELRAREGVPALARGIGEFRRLAALASPAGAARERRCAQTRLARLVADRAGVAHQRPLPALARRPLTRRLAGAPARAPGRRSSSTASCSTRSRRSARRWRSLLRAAGVELALVDAGCCGRTALSTGQIDKARAAAAAALAALHERAADGCDLLFIEPSCLSMVCDDWRRLLPGDPRVAEVARGRAPGAGAGRRPGRGRAACASVPAAARCCTATATRRRCRSRRPPERALGAVPGLDVEVLDAGCCGMSGVFGYEAEHYELSVAMAERVLLPAVRAEGPETAVLATGTSCRAQIHDLAGRPALHPLEFLARAPRTPDRPAALARRRRRACTMGGVNLVIVIAGIVGLLVAGYGFVTLTVDAWRRRQYLDIVLAAGGRGRGRRPAARLRRPPAAVACRTLAEALAGPLVRTHS